MLAAFKAAALIGRDSEARAAVRQLLALVPGMTVGGVERHPMFTEAATIGSLLEGLRRAGLPE